MGRTGPGCRTGRSAVSHHIAASLGVRRTGGATQWPPVAGRGGPGFLGTQLSPVVAPGFPPVWPGAEPPSPRCPGWTSLCVWWTAWCLLSPGAVSGAVGQAGWHGEQVTVAKGRLHWLGTRPVSPDAWGRAPFCRSKSWLSGALPRELCPGTRSQPKRRAVTQSYSVCVAQVLGLLVVSR